MEWKYLSIKHTLRYFSLHLLSGSRNLRIDGLRLYTRMFLLAPSFFTSFGPRCGNLAFLVILGAFAVAVAVGTPTVGTARGRSGMVGSRSIIVTTGAAVGGAEGVGGGDGALRLALEPRLGVGPEVGAEVGKEVGPLVGPEVGLYAKGQYSSEGESVSVFVS